MEVILDTSGAERGPGVVAEAGCSFIRKTGHRVCLVGRADELKTILSRRLNEYPDLRITDASDSVSMEEEAEEALGRKPEASIRVAMRECGSAPDRAVVSPGHTGATVLAAKEHLGLLPGVKRTCLCQILPTSDEGRRILLADAGASLMAEPADLFRFALMARAAAGVLLDIREPSTGLLNIGSEPGKGDPFLNDSHALMTRHLPGFSGNIEGHDIWRGAVDIVLTHGITGNILLKSAEGFTRMLFQSISSLTAVRESAGLMAAMSRFSSSSYGGAVLLGVNGVCIVCHGRADTDDIVTASSLSVRCLAGNLTAEASRQLDLHSKPVTL